MTDSRDVVADAPAAKQTRADEFDLVVHAFERAVQSPQSSARQGPIEDQRRPAQRQIPLAASLLHIVDFRLGFCHTWQSRRWRPNQSISATTISGSMLLTLKSQQERAAAKTKYLFFKEAIL
jgi:hypothetical protein